MNAAQRVFRSLNRAPGFVAIATLSMGVALGISTSVFAVMDATTHPDPPFRDVDQLADVEYGISMKSPPPPSLLNRAVTDLDGVERVVGWTWATSGMVMIGYRFNATLVGRVALGYFDLLGARATVGRLFSTTDHERGDVAVVSDKFWRRDFQNRSIIGDATVQSDGRVYRIVGVLPSGTDCSVHADVFIAEPDRVQGWPHLLVRLKSGVTITEFQPRIKALNERLALRKDRAARPVAPARGSGGS